MSNHVNYVFCACVKAKLPSSCDFHCSPSGDAEYEVARHKAIMDVVPAGFEVAWRTQGSWPKDRDGMTWIFLYCTDETRALFRWKNEAETLRKKLAHIMSLVNDPLPVTPLPDPLPVALRNNEITEADAEALLRRSQQLCGAKDERDVIVGLAEDSMRAHDAMRVHDSESFAFHHGAAAALKELIAEVRARESSHRKVEVREPSFMKWSDEMIKAADIEAEVPITAGGDLSR